MTDLEKIEAMKKANWTPGIEHWKRRAEAAEAALKTARDNALEEAGRKVDALVQEFRINASACRETHPDFADDRDEHADDLEALAAAIRAMKEKPSAAKDATSGV